MPVAAIRSQLATILGGISGIGQVYEYDRFAVPPENFPAVYQVSGAIQVATVAWAAQRRQLLTNRDEQLTHTFVIRVVQQLTDPAASGVAFQGLVTAVAGALGDDPTLGGTADALGDLGGGDYLTMEEIQVQSFAGVALVHVATLRLAVSEVVARVG